MKHLSKLSDFISKNWYSVFLIILISFAIYWFGIRPVQIRKDCSIKEWTEPARQASANWPECERNDSNPSPTSVSPKNSQECYGPKAGVPAKTTPLITDANGVVTMSQTSPAIPAIPASTNWPECEKENPFNNLEEGSAYEKLVNEFTCYPAREEERIKRKATDSEFKSCLRKNGI